MDALELGITKGSTVCLNEFPGSNLINWVCGTVIKISHDYDELLIEAFDEQGKLCRFWEFVSNVNLGAQ